VKAAYVSARKSKLAPIEFNRKTRSASVVSLEGIPHGHAVASLYS
jgi:hypothetical protein